METRRKDTTDNTNASISIGDDKPHLNNVEVEDGEASLGSTLFLDHVGEVILTFNSDGLSWKLLESFNNDESICLGIKFVPKVATEIKFSNVYGVEFINYGLIQGPNHPNVGKYFLSRKSHESEMHRFTVHGVQKSQTQPCLWFPTTYTFGHKDLQRCQIWVNQINASLKIEVERPKNLLVFVNPRSGKTNGCRTWETVAPIFSRADVQTKVVVTQKAGHAFDLMASLGNNELNLYDGVLAVGGDGFFNEILNGFLLPRHKAPFPPSPSDVIHFDESKGNTSVPESNEMGPGTSYKDEDSSPLISSSTLNELGFRTEDASFHTDQDLEFHHLRERFRFGIIPAGSTDAIVMCTTGARDPVTSALHIILGKRVYLDIAQVVRWKTSYNSDTEPCVRYAASFAGYGFYGDVITESEKCRWMGPKRYDYAGTQVFLRHRSYEAEVAYIETEAEKTNPMAGKGHLLSRMKPVWGLEKSERAVCRVNCSVCSTKPVYMSTRSLRAAPYLRPDEIRWQICKGRFLSIGAAVISNRNERAPDGLVVDAHLSDGFLHLLLIRDCPRALYLWHLTQLAKRGGKPLDFEFVEHHKTPAFTFTSVGKESMWNLDGELFRAHQLSAQVFQGLISLFASGPEV